MRQAILTALRNFACAASSPIAESPTVPGQTGATSDPTANPLPAMIPHIASFESSEPDDRRERLLLGLGVLAISTQREVIA